MTRTEDAYAATLLGSMGGALVGLVVAFVAAFVITMPDPTRSDALEVIAHPLLFIGGVVIGSIVGISAALTVVRATKRWQTIMWFVVFLLFVTMALFIVWPCLIPAVGVLALAARWCVTQ